MTFTYDSGTYSLPDTLEEITLDQQIGWATTYGAELRERERATAELPDEDERDLRSSLLYLERMTKVFSYYSTIPLADVQANIDIKQVLSYVGATQLALAAQERDMVLPDTYEFGGGTWSIQPPDVLPDTVTYAHYMATNDLAQKMLLLSEGDWSVMPSICAAYLRLPGEEFEPTNYLPGTEREVLMRDLPMSIALAVAQFLNATLHLFIQVMEDYIPAE